MSITSAIFTDDDVFDAALPKAVSFCASLLCKNALDELALKFGKPKILCWHVPLTRLVTNTYTAGMWESYREFNGLENNAWEREKFMVTLCPYYSGAAALLQFDDAQAVYDYAICTDSIKADSMILNSDRTLFIYAKLGKGCAYIDYTRLNIPQSTDVDMIDTNAVEISEATDV